MDWNPEQEEIFSYVDKKDNLFIQAYAGCAKSTTIVEFAKRMKETSCIALSFGRQTTEELRERLPKWIDVKTPNSLGHSAWCKTVGRWNGFEEGKIVNLLRPYHLEEEDWLCVRAMVTRARHVGLVPKGQQAIILLEDTNDNWRSLTSYDPEDHLIEIAREILKNSISLSYDGVIDYDDQIYMSSLFGGTFPRYKVGLLDESQDFSLLNIRQIKRTIEGRIICVGDENQSIYAFRGADHGSMQKIKELRPSWTELQLSETFRCPQVIVERRKYYLPNFRAASANPLGTIKEIKGPWYWSDIPKGGTIAILCRNNAPLVSMQMKLSAIKVPYQVVGLEKKPLVSLAKKILPKFASLEEYRFVVDEYFEKENQKLIDAGKENSQSAELLRDKCDCLTAVIDEIEPTSLKEILAILENDSTRDKTCPVIFSTIHAAKGQEYDTVIHLDAWRIPSFFAKTQNEFRQESNILNVVETRVRLNLVIANVNKFWGK